MKKVLFATTALVAFAGAAAAEVTLSGSAEMGIVGGDGIETQFHQDIDVKFSMEAESDSGLTFGATVDLDEVDASPAFIHNDANSDGIIDAGELEVAPKSYGNALDNSRNDNGYYVYVKGSFGNLTLGDTDGALDWALKEAGNVGNPGSIADNETGHAGYNGSYGDSKYDGQILRYDNTFGQFGVAISYEQGAESYGDLLPAAPSGSVALGVKYAFDLSATTINLGVGYQKNDYNTASDQKIWGLSLDAAFAGGFSAGIVYSDWSDVGGVANADADHLGLGIGYESGPFSVHANYGNYDFGAGVADKEGFGLAAAYDLGGGLSANFGYGHSDTGPNSSDDNWSLGMVMSF